MDGFHELVVNTLNSVEFLDVNSMVAFKKKLQFLKSAIRKWNLDNRLLFKTEKANLSFVIAAMDALVDSGVASKDDLILRQHSVKKLTDILNDESKDLSQKAKINWSVEGDENSKFFHGILKKKRRQMAIKGIMKDGNWLEDPNLIKSEFFEHFSHRFSPIVSSRMCDRAPGPDGFSFVFFKAFWSIIEKDVVRFVEDFFITSHFPKGCNSSFIALIPKITSRKFVSGFRPISPIGCQYKIIGKLLANRLSLVIGSCISPEQSAFIKGRNILDGPVIPNEIMEWYRKRKSKLLVFKVDFEKAFDSLRWDFLDLMMEEMGFGSKWRRWIEGCLMNARPSILVDGSPTAEFDICRGLRKGYPLSPFLFIIAMEGLHAVIRKAMFIDLFKGAPISGISHLMYADDVIFLGEWKARTLSIRGRMVLLEVVLGNLPTYYMSIYRMSVDVETRLESIRNSFFVGGDLEDMKMTWIAWKKCLDSKELEGLGIDRGIDKACINSSLMSPWKMTINAVISLSKKGLDLLSLCVRNIGKGNSTLFWEDVWCGDIPLKTQFPRVFALDLEKNCTVTYRLKLCDWFSIFRRHPRGGEELVQFTALKSFVGLVVLGENQDYWLWSPNAFVGYTIASARTTIDSQFLEISSQSTRWNRFLPSKVNILFWRLRLNKVNTIVNLDRHGIDIGSVFCPICGNDVDTVNHLLFTCGQAMDLWSLVSRWWEVDMPLFSSISVWLSWLDSTRLSIQIKRCLDAVVNTMFWALWSFQNSFLFAKDKPRKTVIWDSIQSQSFFGLILDVLSLELTGLMGEN
ncbi:uncharacterized protein LOC111895365 [Lactuca sativa]|uniref:uncharacterized protein LOC111895365 n=1 Tax=Lactuca sativa TaxID=4236 RepID=UPI000CD81FCF|nr:uncharacterized protein LOC111895365 [Lactuca sativa]